MIIDKTALFHEWLKRLPDIRAKERIVARIRRMEILESIPGDIKPVGKGVYEMRFHFGPGYRVYFTIHNDETLVLLAGGDKSTQKRDITQARRLKEGLTRR